MKLKYNFVTSVVADKTVAVAIGNELGKKNGIIKMNETGAFIFNMLKNDVEKKAIVDALENEYEGATRKELEKAVDSFLAELKKCGVLNI